MGEIIEWLALGFLDFLETSCRLENVVGKIRNDVTGAQFQLQRQQQKKHLNSHVGVWP